MNPLDNKQVRDIYASRTTEQMIDQATFAFVMTLAAAQPATAKALANTVRSINYSQISATVIWLQERGVTIPADICAYLKIEDVRHATH